MEAKKINREITEKAQSTQRQLIKGKKTTNEIRLEFGLNPINDDISNSLLLQKSEGEKENMDYKKVLDDQITKLEEVQEKARTSTMHLDVKCNLMCEISKNILALVETARNPELTKINK